MLFVVKKGITILVAKSIDDSFAEEDLDKLELSQAFAFKKSLMAVDPFGLNTEVLCPHDDCPDELKLLMHKGYYGFKNNKNDKIYLINSKDIKIFE